MLRQQDSSDRPSVCSLFGAQMDAGSVIDLESVDEADEEHSPFIKVQDF